MKWNENYIQISKLCGTYSNWQVFKPNRNYHLFLLLIWWNFSQVFSELYVNISHWKSDINVSKYVICLNKPSFGSITMVASAETSLPASPAALILYDPLSSDVTFDIRSVADFLSSETMVETLPPPLSDFPFLNLNIIWVNWLSYFSWN